jgi:hypothetical protein
MTHYWSYFFRLLRPPMYSNDYDIIYRFLCLFVSYGSYLPLKMYLHVYVYVFLYVCEMPV